jgi:hypothetical protein
VAEVMARWLVLKSVKEEGLQVVSAAAVFG